MGQVRPTSSVLIVAAGVALSLGGAAAGQPLSDRERFEADQAHRRGELALAAGDQALRKADLALRREEQQRSRWTNPLVLAIVAAAIAAFGNALVAFVNGRQQRELERQRAFANRALERTKAENEIALERDKAEAQVKLERDKAKAQLRLDALKAESDRILEVIKTGGTEGAAENLQFLLSAGLVAQDGLGKRLATFLATRKPGTGPTLPAGDERFQFAPDMKAADVERVLNALRAFGDYLDTVGFERSQRKIDVAKDDIPNAYYNPASARLVIGEAFLDDPFAAFRPYMHHVLLEACKGHDDDDPGIQSIQSGLSDYFPASFSDNPLLGEKAARALKLDRPYIRSLKSEEGYGDLGPDTMFHNGQIWGSLFWDIRSAVGSETADRLLRLAWTDTEWPTDRRRSPRAFLATLVGKACEQKGAELAVAARMRKRGFPVPRPSRTPG